MQIAISQFFKHNPIIQHLHRRQSDAAWIRLQILQPLGDFANNVSVNIGRRYYNITQKSSKSVIRVGLTFIEIQYLLV